jgi:WD40 repeat protein
VIRDAINGNVIRLIDNPAELSAVCSGRYGKTLVTATREGDLLLWDSATGRRLTELKAHPEGVGILVCSASGDRILSVSEDHFHAKLWDVNAMTISAPALK